MVQDLNHLTTTDGAGSNGHPGSYESIRTRVLALKGKKSYGLIAKEVGLTRNQVAGIMFRASHPYTERIAASPGIGNKIGTGYRTGAYARECIRNRGSLIGRRSLKVREALALAIERADNQRIPEGYANGFDHPEISDWGLYLADEILKSIGRVWLDRDRKGRIK